jgi:hypothetical protein
MFDRLLPSPPAWADRLWPVQAVVPSHHVCSPDMEHAMPPSPGRRAAAATAPIFAAASRRLQDGDDAHGDRRPVAVALPIAQLARRRPKAVLRQTSDAQRASAPPVASQGTEETGNRGWRAAMISEHYLMDDEAADQRHHETAW